jgi:hypothetical protein
VLSTTVPGLILVGRVRKAPPSLVTDLFENQPEASPV